MKLLSQEQLTQQIYLIREQKVMLDINLSKLYQVETKYLNRQVKRNIERFPSDFMFQLTDGELENLRCQIVTANFNMSRNNPYVFTEHGILMLSSVLRSSVAIDVNISIMRTFNKLREFTINYKDIVDRLDKTDKDTNEKFKIVFDALQQIMYESETLEPKVIGFIK